ncbi:hypothetical protein CR152_24915 [Massilia violaceinigra]|uniref:DUF2069 domain-containing protein n=1 Tax=Massilia violaceinigra TaxID=2045208 RepID=A0A2D2DQX6_9BURK|nr:MULTISPECIES: DUF2069 domain-containing protein [Massilia]ATQ77378.1 hypothetical protein CR152_24915 [Massilia violaceinigra]MDQ1921256.1 DUF2069 domain-containing protein [Massilia sp. CCM 9206]
MQAPKYFHIGAIASLVVLIAWLLAWEIVVAPLRPGSWILALKVLPLLIPLGGVIKRDIYTLQWSSMVILLYFTEGVVRAWSDKLPVSRMMAMGEIVLVFVYFACALLYLRPYKKAAKKMAKELLDKVNSTKSTK